jgi:hypothetical protein
MVEMREREREREISQRGKNKVDSNNFKQKVNRREIERRVLLRERKGSTNTCTSVVVVVGKIREKLFLLSLFFSRLRHCCEEKRSSAY